MTKKKEGSTRQQQHKGDRSNISPEAHREAERVAKNLFRLPPKRR